jgi:hypothetical protein
MAGIGPISSVPALPATAPVSPDRQPGKPELGEQTEAQLPLANWATALGGLSRNGPNCDANPCGFPWYGSLYLGTYDTYRWMLEHPIIQHARSQAFDPIRSASLGYEAKRGVTKKRIDFVRDNVEPLWSEYINDVLRAVDYGWAGFEKVWEVVKGDYVLRALKALRVDTTQILIDKDNGAFAGLRYGGTDDWLGLKKCALFTYDREFGNLYGRSRLENMRSTAWRDWLDAATDLMRLTDKISGVMPVVYTPPGSFKTPDGSTVKWSDNARTILQAAKRAIGVHLTHLGAQSPAAGLQNFEQLLALIKASAVRLDVIDFGANSPAIASILDRMKHDEESMFAGYFQSPRTGMATTGGTKADAQQHTDTATLNGENLSGQIVGAFNRSVVDDLLELKYGPDARGSVWCKPGKLTDANLAIDNKVLDAILADPDLRMEYIPQIDVDAITERRGIPKRDGNEIVLEAVPSDTTTVDTAALDGPDTQGQ